MLLSYKTFKTAKCARCQRGLDEMGMMPLGRELAGQSARPQNGSKAGVWEAVHESCIKS
jgi:Mediator complex subunit 27